MHQAVLVPSLIIAMGGGTAMAAQPRLSPGKPAGVKAATIIHDETPYFIGAGAAAAVLSGLLFFRSNGSTTSASSTSP
jgi:hypothetical protein